MLPRGEPDLVSKLREALQWCLNHTKGHEVTCNLNQQERWDEAQQALSDCANTPEVRGEGEAISIAQAEINVKRNQCTCGYWEGLKLAESLLGREGQAAHLKYVPSEVVGPTMGHWVCDCGKDLGDCPIDEIDEIFALHQAEVSPSPSTPIVPSTPDDPRFDGVVVEVAEEFAILEEDITTLRRILGRLVAEREAQIRKDVLEEAAQVAKNKYEQWRGSGAGVTAELWDIYEAIRALAERPAPAGEVRSGWEQGYDKAIREALEAGLPQLEWANIHGSRCEELLRWVKDLLRLSPAGEVRISRWQCPHCAHVNLMTSANCENCKIPLVNTAGEVKGEK